MRKQVKIALVFLLIFTENAFAIDDKPEAARYCFLGEKPVPKELSEEDVYHRHFVSFFLKGSEVFNGDYYLPYGTDGSIGSFRLPG